MVTKAGFMQEALHMARQGELAGEVPVGAIVVLDGEIIGRGINQTRRDNDPSAHAEIVAMRQAASHIGSARLAGCDLWVTLEPCTMCAGAISHARIRRLYYGAKDTKGGAVESGVRFFNSPACLHAPDVYSGIAESECADLLTAFFAARRD
ncbi:MAG: tRNA adenosine(34) deaminase TadA [Pseudomonadota bacterium]